MTHKPTVSAIHFDGSGHHPSVSACVSQASGVFSE